MSLEDDNPLISPNQLISSIDSFAESVTRYLSPVVRFVGHKDKYYDSLYRKFPGLSQEKRYSRKPAHLVVFDEVPEKFLTAEMPLSPEAAYVMCLDDETELSKEQHELLRSRVSATLFNPTVDELYWHTKALLMVQDVCFSNGHSSFPELMSVDVEFRRSLAELIVSSINFKSCLVIVETESFKNSLIDFLFGSLPSLIKPFEVSLDHLDRHSLPEDRITLVEASCKTHDDIEQVLTLIEPTSYAKPLISIVTIDPALYDDIPNAAPVVYLKGLNSRDIDAQLISYWCAMYNSSLLKKPKYYSEDQIATAVLDANNDSAQFIEHLLRETPTLDSPSESFNDLVSKYDRPSIDDIFNEAELIVMRNLHSNASIVDAASSAAGIPTVTFSKRLRRLGEKDSFIGLISDSSNVN